MNILAADDEPLALDMLTGAIKEALPGAEVYSFLKPSKLLEYASSNTCEIAFLDINMRGITGLELAKKLKEANKDVNIIFVTGYDEFTGAAMAMHASGYIMKPVTADKICTELAELRRPVKSEKNILLKFKCFGNFEAYTPNGEIIHFDRSKSKEVLAYLVYRSGASCTTKEIAAVLFEDEEYDKKQQGYVQKIIFSLIKKLKENNAEAVIRRNYNNIAIDVAKVECDYYDFYEKSMSTKNKYSGEFMAQYSWAEFVVGYLEKMYWKK